MLTGDTKALAAPENHFDAPSGCGGIKLKDLPKCKTSCVNIQESGLGPPAIKTSA